MEMKRTLHLSARLKNGERYDADLPIEHVVLLPGELPRANEKPHSTDVLFVRMRASKQARVLVDLKYHGPYTVWVNEGENQYYVDYDARIEVADMFTYIPLGESYKPDKRRRYMAIELYMKSAKQPGFLYRPPYTESILDYPRAREYPRTKE